MSKSLIDAIDRQELLDKLNEAGYGDLIDTLLSNEKKVYTKKGRLNKSGACRLLKCKTKDLEEKLEACKDILRQSLE
jgi:hypothetical protein